MTGLLSVADVKQLLSVTEPTVRVWIKEGNRRGRDRTDRRDWSGEREPRRPNLHQRPLRSQGAKSAIVRAVG